MSIQPINWYPGHMAKAKRELESRLKQVHLVIEVLDARIPKSSQNPLLKQVIKQKPRLVVLNKKDLADPEVTSLWMDWFNAKSNTQAIAINALKKSDMKKIIAYCEQQLLQQKKSFQRLHVMIVGIPNVGKSQLINQLSGKKAAKVENRPAVTQRQQWVALSPTIQLLDTPGVLWPKFDSETVGVNLGITGAIKDHALPLEDVAFKLLRDIVSYYPQLLKDRFKLSDLPEDSVELMGLIGQKRGCLERGGDIDYEKTYSVLLHELRSGSLGRITLEKP